MDSSMVISALDAVAQTLSKRAREIEAGTHPAGLSDNADMRREVMQALDALHSSALHPDNPAEVNLWFLSQLSYFTAIRLFIKWGAFEKMPTEKGAAISYTELAAILHADTNLIARVGQVLVAHGALTHVASGTVAHTDFSKTLLTPSGAAPLKLGFDMHAQAWMCAPKYFEQFGLIEPTNPRQSPLALAVDQLGSTAYEIVYGNEKYRESFVNSPSNMDKLVTALGNYDLTWVAKEAERSSDRVLFVDVGGADGRALVRILKQVPALPSRRCVIQDLPPMIEVARKAQDPDLAGVQLLVADFFEEQPVKGALAYYIRHCLHSLSDGECVTVLQRLAEAMAADSRLLIVDVLVGDPPTTRQTTFDMMMLVGSAKERTLANFQRIVGAAGLRITQVSPYANLFAVIECMLA